MNNSSLFSIFITLAITQNFIVALFLGLCPFFGVSQKLSDALSMAAAVTLVMLISASATWTITRYVLIPFDVVFMSNVVYILIIATLVQMIELFLKRTNANLYNAFGIFLPLITTNCAILGITFINLRENFSFVQSVVAAFGGGFGFFLVLGIMAGIREKLRLADAPVSFRGFPQAIFVAALLGLTFFGFGGIG